MAVQGITVQSRIGMRWPL